MSHRSYDGTNARLKVPYQIYKQNENPPLPSAGELLVYNDGSGALITIDDEGSSIPIEANPENLLWAGQWVNRTYAKNTAVTQDGYLMVSNKDTTDNAAPQTSGPAVFVYADDSLLTDQNLTTKALLFGQRYISADAAGFVTGYRVFTTVGNRYQVYSVLNPTSATPVLTELLTFKATSAGWQEFNLTPILVTNLELDIAVIASEPDPEALEVLANYNYFTPNNANNSNFNFYEFKS